MSRQINEILSGLSQDENGVWYSSFENTSQQKEIRLRKKVAAKIYDDYLDEVANHHSVEVMDYEVKRALQQLPENGVIVDVGGCWGWHWRNLCWQRPDVQVVIMDFVKENLLHAQNVLGLTVNKSIHLVHGDATQCPFPDDSFDLYWSVQALQHVPDFVKCVEEAKRILSGEGRFLNYSLNREKAVEILYRVFGKNYVVEGYTGSMFLSRASVTQISQIEKVFDNPVEKRFSEALFHPDLRLKTGRDGSLWGKLDAKIGSCLPILGCIARQQSFQTFK